MRFEYENHSSIGPGDESTGGIDSERDDELERQALQELGMPPSTDLSPEPDEDTSENALERFSLVDDEAEEAEPYERPLLLERMVEETQTWLDRLSVRGIREFEDENFLRICEKIGIIPESRATIVALTDILLAIEEEDYKERSMISPPDIDDLEQQSEDIDDVEEFQNQKTVAAYMYLRKVAQDPILELPFLAARQRELAEKEPTEFGEYDEIQEELHSVSQQLTELTRIKEVQSRREWAFRCMRWLLQQDYLKDELKKFKSDYKDGEKPTFHELAEWLAGKYISVIKREDIAVRTDTQAGGEIVLNLSEGDGFETTEERETGAIDRLLEEHKRQMGEGGKTDRQLVRDASKLRRLEQAKAICEYVFEQDITDRIYLGAPISPLEFNKLEFIRRRLYQNGDTEVLSGIVQFLPGSPSQNMEGSEIREVTLPKKFSGRSLLELFDEINTIILQHPDLDIERVTELVEAKYAGLTTHAHDSELAIDALKILEKLAYKENHSVRALISD